MTRALLIAMLVLLFGCDQILPKHGVGEVLGLKFGVPLDLKIKEGPRDPPAFHGGLREFYEVDFPNMEFDFVGVAVTKNDDANRKDGIVFNREKLIWAAFFNNKKPCEEKDYVRTKEYLAKNWKVSLAKESTNKPGESFFLEGNFTSPSALWEIQCWRSFGLTLVVMDFSVLTMAGDDNTKKKIEKILADLHATLQRKM